MNFTGNVSLVDGYGGNVINYGPYFMVIEQDKMPVQFYRHPVSGGEEFFTLDPIPSNAGYWTTADEVNRAFSVPQAGGPRP